MLGSFGGNNTGGGQRLWLILAFAKRARREGQENYRKFLETGQRHPAGMMTQR
jgi:hypothetical protein